MTGLSDWLLWDFGRWATMQYLVACASPCGNCWYSWNVGYQETRHSAWGEGTTDTWDPEHSEARSG